MDNIKTRIIRSYQRVSRFVFHYLIFLVAVVVAFFVFQNIISQSASINVFQTNENLLMQKTKLIAEFNKFLKQNVKDNDLSVYILQ